jgi:putative DNA primase/helicase
MSTTADVIRASGLLTLGDHPAPDAIEKVLGNLRTAVEGADPIRREAVRVEAVRVLKPLGWRAAAIDNVLGVPQQAAKADDNRQGRTLVLSDPTPWPDPVEGVALLDELVETYSRFLALPDGGADADALWTLHAHAHDASEVSPLLGVTSASKRCGKTTQLSVLQGLVPRPLPASNITAAALYRTIEAHRPTLLVDEADTFLNEKEELRGVLNSGHTRAGAQVIRTVGEDHETRAFTTWAPKAVAMIGDLPDTLRDRAIEIRLRRRRPDEKVEKLRLDRLRDLEPLRQRCARWAADNLAELRDADPDVPDDLHDRAADNWRPLLAIADLAGGEWPERARQAARLLSGLAADQDGDAAVLLLADLNDLFISKVADRLPSAEIVTALGKMEDRPWPEWKRGQPITARQVARLLQPFDVHPKKIRFGDSTAQGYDLDSFSDAFGRYLPAEPEQSEQSSQENGNHPSANRNNDPAVPDAKTGDNACGTRDVPTVPDPEPDPIEQYEAEWEALREREGGAAA